MTTGVGLLAFLSLLSLAASSFTPSNYSANIPGVVDMLAGEMHVIAATQSQQNGSVIYLLDPVTLAVKDAWRAIGDCSPILMWLETAESDQFVLFCATSGSGCLPTNVTVFDASEGTLSPRFGTRRVSGNCPRPFSAATAPMANEKRISCSTGGLYLLDYSTPNTAKALSLVRLSCDDFKSVKTVKQNFLPLNGTIASLSIARQNAYAVVGTAKQGIYVYDVVRGAMLRHIQAGDYPVVNTDVAVAWYESENSSKDAMNISTYDFVDGKGLIASSELDLMGFSGGYVWANPDDRDGVLFIGSYQGGANGEYASLSQLTEGLGNTWSVTSQVSLAGIPVMAANAEAVYVAVDDYISAFYYH